MEARNAYCENHEEQVVKSNIVTFERAYYIMQRSTPPSAMFGDQLSVEGGPSTITIATVMTAGAAVNKRC